MKFCYFVMFLMLFCDVSNAVWNVSNSTFCNVSNAAFWNISNYV